MLPMCARLHLSSHHLCHGDSQLSKQQSWNTVGRQLITSDAKSASDGKADAVQAEFAKAGISAEITQMTLKQYKPYLNWDIETKLRPALQSWLQVSSCLSSFRKCDACSRASRRSVVRCTCGYPQRVSTLKGYGKQTHMS